MRGASVVLAGLVVLASLSTFALEAEAGTLCQVTAQSPTCQFNCATGDNIEVHAQGPDLVTISGTCSGVTTTCQNLLNCHHTSANTVAQNGVGTCSLTNGDSGWCRGINSPGGPPCTEGPCISIKP